VLLVVAGLAHYTRFGFAMKPTAWSKFLGGHQFANDDCEIKLDSKKIDLDVPSTTFLKTMQRTRIQMVFLLAHKN